MKTRHMFAAMLGFMLLLGTPNLSIAQNIVVPSGNAAVEGGSANGYPFHIGFFSLSQQRYQQVYSSSEFSSIGSPILISQIAFRPSSNFGAAFSTILPDVQINLSTTPALPDALSLTYANNVGADDTIVYTRGALPLSSSFTGSGPKDFDIVITLTTPFLYDPASGSLLLDVRNFGGGTTTFFDATNAPGIMSRLYNEDNDVNAVTGTPEVLGAGYGLITQFTFAAVPEPTTWALIGVCTAATGAYTWKKQRKNIKNRFAKKK
ncbi:MAG TPA: hypothetical protein PLN21_22170 [Gemmatales bacterium]|nr:hypothetical protein [Gemmatales bacterium]